MWRGPLGGFVGAAIGVLMLLADRYYLRSAERMRDEQDRDVSWFGRSLSTREYWATQLRTTRSMSFVPWVLIVGGCGLGLWRLLV